MATTTNYGWTTPDDTALVKDGAAAIRTLGSSIDTSLNTALGTKKAGLVLLNTTSFSAVSSQSINSVFSATYNNYRIVAQIYSPSADANLRLRWRKSGTDNSTASSYYGMFNRASAGGVNGVLNTNGETSVSLLTMDLANNERVYGFGYDVINPFVSSYTVLWGNATGIELDSSNFYGFSGASHHRVTDSFDGFTIFPASGNITGSVSVYGYNN
jgi:hypothetical protein